MNNSYLANINPTVFSWSAVLIGTVLCEELSAVEQGAIGNWLVLVGDYLLTNSSQLAVIEANTNTSSSTNQNNNNQMETLQKAIHRIEEELEQLKKDYGNRNPS